jgi:hypothetical protein
MLFSVSLLAFLQLGGHSLFSFSEYDYDFNSHHFEYTSDHQFNLARDLTVYDGNFYLYIADALSSGEPIHPSPDAPRGNSNMAFAFAPLYPIAIALFNLLVQNIYLSALIASLILSIAAFYVLFRVLEKYKNARFAARATWLVFLSPAAVFLHLHFSEGLALLLMALLLGACLSKRWLAGSIIVGLLAVTRFQFLVLIPLMMVLMFRDKLPIRRICGYLLLMVLPMMCYIAVVWAWTGDPLYFTAIRSQWMAIPLAPIVVPTVWALGELPFQIHSFSISLVDELAALASGALLWFSRKALPSAWWWVALLSWAFPLIASGNMSNLRYSLLLLPLYIFVASKIKPTWLWVVLLGLLAISQFILLAYAVNYHWLG